MITTALILIVFALGYMAIIAEHYLKLNKTAVALFVAAICWSIYFYSGLMPMNEQLASLGHHVNHIAQIVFFLLGAMTIVELIDAHEGFRAVSNCLRTSSKRRLMIVISVLSFFLSSVLDNLTTTILMVSLLRKLVPDREDRLLLCCIIVVAANAGGAWTPIGDVTTTMLWIDGQISSWAIMKALFAPSVISLLIPLAIYLVPASGKYAIAKTSKEEKAKVPGSKLVLCLGISALVFVPIFKSITGLPPFMGILIGLGLMWLITDFMHRGWENRVHLKVPHILSKIDISGVLFFLGILLCVASLETSGILQKFSYYLSSHIESQAILATMIGIISAIIDNVPLVAATMGMYPISQFPQDHTLWHMIAYAAGTGGSILIIGSAAGVALMGMEKIDFITYLKKASLPVLAGYLAGMGVYLLLR